MKLTPDGSQLMVLNWGAGGGPRVVAKIGFFCNLMAILVKLINNK